MKDFSVGMALVDFLPVIFFAAGAVLLMRDLYNKMSKGAFALFAAGAIDITCAGMLKACYKLLYAAGVCDFEALNTLFFPMHSIGFLLGRCLCGGPTAVFRYVCICGIDGGRAGADGRRAVYPGGQDETKKVDGAVYPVVCLFAGDGLSVVPGFYRGIDELDCPGGQPGRTGAVFTGRMGFAPT